MNPIVELIRLEENDQYGTFGALRIQKRLFCTTLEPGDLENRKNISSIPAQQYTCRRFLSNKFGMTFQIMNVPGRDSILFHPGNFVFETQGCVLLAQHPSKLIVANIEHRAVLNSGLTFKAFMNIMDGYEEFHLTIVECF